MRSTILDNLLAAQTSGMFPNIKRVFILITTFYHEQLGDRRQENNYSCRIDAPRAIYEHHQQCNVKASTYYFIFPYPLPLLEIYEKDRSTLPLQSHYLEYLEYHWTYAFLIDIVVIDGAVWLLFMVIFEFSIGQINIRCIKILFYCIIYRFSPKYVDIHLHEVFICVTFHLISQLEETWFFQRFFTRKIH